MADYIVTASVPARITALTQIHADKIDKLVERGHAMLAARITDAASHLAGSQLHAELHQAEKELEARRVEVKAPALAVCTAIDEIAKPYRDAIVAAKKPLGIAVATWQFEENARIARENAAAAQRAEDERKRLEKEAEEDRCPVADAFAPPAVVHVEAPPPEPEVKSSVRVAMVPKLVIVDATLIPRELGGETLLVPDEAAILRVLKRKLPVGGCRLDLVPDVRAKAAKVGTFA